MILAKQSKMEQSCLGYNLATAATSGPSDRHWDIDIAIGPVKGPEYVLSTFDLVPSLADGIFSTIISVILVLAKEHEEEE